MSTGWTSTLYERSISDILESERQIRAVLEDEHRKLIAVLERLAKQHHGRHFEEYRRTNPTGAQYWTAQDWEKFFLSAPRGIQIQPAASWTSVSSNGNGHKAIQLEREVQRLRSENNRLKAENTEHLQKRPQTEGRRSRSAPPKKVVREKSSPRSSGQAIVAAPESVPASPLAGFKTPMLPLKYSQLESEFGSIQWRRALMILYLLATYGINSHVEIDRHIAPVEGLVFRSNSTKKPVRKLAEIGLTVMETIKIDRDPEMGFAIWVLRLTDSGRELCQAFGWQPVESEWERMIRLHQGDRLKEHTLAVLYFALLARARGYDVAVMPDTQAGNTSPDVRITRNGKSHLVEIELGKRDVSAKWRNMKTAQGYVAICALYPAGRDRLVKDCKLAKIPGMAADLETLKAVKIYETTASDPLWLEQWK